MTRHSLSSRSKHRLTIAAVAALAGATLLTGAADATDDDALDTSGWNVVVETTGQVVPFDDLGDLIPEPSPAAEGEVTPRLIDDPVAWGSCFGPFYNRDYSLAAFDDVPDASGTIYLQCGPHDTKTYGWHHIQVQHEDDWQTRIDTANAMTGRTGGNWDDLMAFSAMAATTGPAQWTIQYDGKRCYYTPITITDQHNNAVFTYHPTVVVSMTNSRVITAYPSTSQDCSRQAPWES